MLCHIPFSKHDYFSYFGLWLAACGIFIPLFQVMEWSQTACICSDAIKIKRIGITQEDEAMFHLNCNIIITANKEQIECAQLEPNRGPGHLWSTKAVLEIELQEGPQACSDW